MVSHHLRISGYARSFLPVGRQTTRDSRGRVKFTLNQEIWSSRDRAFRMYPRGRVGSIGISFRPVSRCIFQRLSHSLFRNMLWASWFSSSSPLLVLLHSLWPGSLQPNNTLLPVSFSFFALSLSLPLFVAPWNLFNAHDIGSTPRRSFSVFAQPAKSNSQRRRDNLLSNASNPADSVTSLCLHISPSSLSLFSFSSFLRFSRAEPPLRSAHSKLFVSLIAKQRGKKVSRSCRPVWDKRKL